MRYCCSRESSTHHALFLPPHTPFARPFPPGRPHLERRPLQRREALLRAPPLLRARHRAPHPPLQLAARGGGGGKERGDATEQRRRGGAERDRQGPGQTVRRRPEMQVGLRAHSARVACGRLGARTRGGGERSARRPADRRADASAASLRTPRRPASARRAQSWPPWDPATRVYAAVARRRAGRCPISLPRTSVAGPSPACPHSAAVIAAASTVSAAAAAAAAGTYSRASSRAWSSTTHGPRRPADAAAVAWSASEGRSGAKWASRVWPGGARAGLRACADCGDGAARRARTDALARFAKAGRPGGRTAWPASFPCLVSVRLKVCEWQPCVRACERESLHMSVYVHVHDVSVAV
jgi:hypothetical protein